MSPPAVLLGRTFADATRQILVLVVLSITGYLVGWRINNGLLDALWAYALLLLFAYTVAWIGAWVGLYMPNPETANTAGLIWLFPLTFLSNCFVPINSLPGWLQTFAAWNPISALVLSCRELFGNPTGIQPDYWPLHNAELYTLLSCTVLIAIFATLAVRRYMHSTSR
jgi:ABC-type multidrug transport system permease subunit